MLLPVVPVVVVVVALTGKHYQYLLLPGAGGTPGVSSGNGAASSAVLGSTVTAAGGNGGTFSATNGVGGTGGTGGTFNGGTGSAGASANYGGGGGGGAGTAANGNTQTNTATGATAVAGGGAGGNGASGANGDGLTGSAPGGGGGGCRAGGTVRTGGIGGNGKVIISWTCPTYSLTSTSGTTPVCITATTTTINLSASAANLPVGTYTVTYNRSSPVATGLTAAMTVSVAGTGSFTASGLTTAGSSTITVTNLSSGVTGATCSSTISSNNSTVISVTGAPTSVAGTAVTTCSTSGAVSITAGSSATNQSSVAWTSSGSGTFANATSLTLCTYTPSAADITAGSVTLTLTANGNSPCGNVTSTKTLTINDIPTAVAGTAITTCSNSGAVNITAGSSATNQVSVAWTSSGSGTFANATSLTTCTYNPSAADISAGSVTLTLTANGNSPCGNVTSTKAFTITAAPTSVAGTAVTTCSTSGAVNITAGSSSTNSTGVTWTSNGTGTFANPNSLTLCTYTPSAADISAGSRTLTLTATGNSPCGNTTSTKTITINGVPTANAGTAVNTCSNSGAVNITAGSSATNQASVAWTSSGSGTFANSTSLTTCTYTPSAADITAGSVTLTLTANGNSPCGNATSNKTLTINPAPTSVAGTAISTCSNSGAVNITAGSSATNQASVTWTSSGTGTFTNANSLTLCTYAPSAADITAGSRTLTLTAVGNAGCSNATSNKTITITSAPTAVAGTAVTTCSNSGAVNITAGSSATNQASVTWTSSGTGTFASANSLTLCTYTPSAADISAGSVTLTLTATGNGTCSNATSTKTLTINAAPTAVAGVPVSTCYNSGAVNITAGSSATNQASITWTSSGTGTFANATSLTTCTYSPSAADITAGSVTLTLTAIGNSGCSNAVSTKTLTIISLPAAPGTITGSAAVCSGASLTYSISAVSGATSYTWAVPTGWSISSGQGTTSIAVASGNNGQNGNITVSADNTCGSSSAVRTANINPVVATNNTGYTSSTTKTSGDINCNSGTLRGYVKFPLSALPAGSVISSSTLSLENNGSLTLSTATNTITALGTNDPTTASASTLYNAIGSGATYSSATWSNTGTVVLSLNSTANTDIQNGISSPGYIAMGQLRGGTATYIFYGYAGGVNAPELAITYNSIRSLAVSVTTTAPTAVAGTAVSTCSNSGAVNITAGSSATNQASVAWTSSGTGTFANANSLTTCTYTPSAADISAGSVTLTLTAAGNSPCGNATSTKTLTITTAPTAVAGTAVSTCSNSGAVNITVGSSATNQASVAWTSSGTGTFANANSLTLCTYTPSAADITAGSRTLTLTATGNGTCANTISTKTLTITAAPTANAGIAVSTCSNSGAVNITAGSSAGNNAGVTWTSSGTGSFANATSLALCTYTPSAADITAGSVTLILTATGNGTCANAISTKTLIINHTSASTTTVSVCSNTLPFVWNGNNYNATGSYTLHFTNAANCDSAATLDLTVRQTSSSTTTVSVCSNTLPYVWNGNNYNATGSYTLHFTNAANCDSVATLDLTVRQTSSSTTTVSVCSNTLPFVWNGNNYNATGSYTLHFTNAANCDSAATLDLTVRQTSTSTSAASICSDEIPFVWNGNNYNATGSYTVHFTNAVSCDSAATLNLTVRQTSSSTTAVSVCSDALPYVWNGNNYNATGSYTLHFTNTANCDSAATLDLTVRQTSSSTTTVSVCSDALPYVWNGNNYNSTGSYTLHFTNAANCDSAATLDLTVRQISSSTTVVSICSDEVPYMWNGNNYNSTGSYTLHFTNAANCDSAATLNLIVRQTSSSTTAVSVCSDALPFVWNGNNYNATGLYTLHFTNAANCDSAATLDLTVRQISSSTTVVSICSDEVPYVWNGNNYNATGSYTLHFTNAANCDSTATLNLTVRQTSTSTSTANICSDEIPFVWNGNNYNATGSYTIHFTNAANCDSAATLNLTVRQTSTSTTTVSVCSDALPYVWNGNNYSASGLYTLHFTNAVNCDSAATLDLTVRQTSTSTTVVSICSDELPYVWNGNNYNATGSYTLHFTNAANCDSAATLDLTVRQTSSSITTVSVCSDVLPYVWNGNDYNATGSYTVHLTNAVNCDSITTLDLTVRQTSSSVADITICSGTSYTPPGGTPLTTSGTYVTHIANAVNCDSAITTNLTVLTLSTAPSGIISNAPYNEICLGNNVILTVQGGSLGDGAKWVWYKGGCGSGAVIDTGASISVMPTTASTYYVRAEGPCNTTSCVSIAITVKTSGPVGVITTVTGPSAGCTGGTGVVNCNAVPNATYYSWSSYPGTLFNGQPGPYQTTVPTVTVTYGPLPFGAGGYNVCVFAGNACGVTANTKCYWIQGGVSVPTFSNSNSAVACAGNTRTYSVLQQTGASSYTWTITGNATITSGQGTNTVTINFLSGWTSGNLCVYASLSCGANSGSRCMSISGTPGIPGVMNGPLYVCPGSTYTYTVGAAVGAATYNWTAPAGCTIVNNGTSANITFPVGFTSGPIVAAAVSPCGIQGTTRYQTVGSGRPLVPGNIQGEAFGLCGQQYIFTVPSVSNATGYAWTVPTGATIVNGQGSNSITVSFITGFLNGNICVSATNSCGSGGQRCLFVKGSPATPVAITGNTGVCAGSIESYSIVPGTGAVTHAWTVPSGATILFGQGTTSITVLWGSTGGNVGVVAYNSCGNSGQPRILAVTISCRTVQHQATVVPLHAEVFPNPAHDKINLKFISLTEDNCTIRLFDITGREMLNEIRKAQIGENLVEFNLDGFAKGLYILDIRNGEEKQVIRVSIE
ncbi:MAG: T9SS type A sorting domain-containing protein [Bacteroidetes bacterium]|nr:T9SS type A sorting domain-containing protein [Bacteroidota bacterium]